MRFQDGQIEHEVFGVKALSGGQNATILQAEIQKPTSKVRIELRRSRGQRVDKPFQVTLTYLRADLTQSRQPEIASHSTFSAALRAYADQLDWWEKH